MKKVFVFLLVFVCLLLGSCVKDVISYCPFCGKADIKEISEYDVNTGKTEIYYECQNSKCGITFFGAGQIKTDDAGDEK